MSDAPIPTPSSSSDAADTSSTGGDTPSGKIQAQVRKVADTASQVGRNLADQAGAAQTWAADRAGVARDWAADQGDVMRDTVQVRPFISVGVSAAFAFSAGLVLGMLLTRR